VTLREVEHPPPGVGEADEGVRESLLGRLRDADLLPAERRHRPRPGVGDAVEADELGAPVRVDHLEAEAGESAA